MDGRIIGNLTLKDSKINFNEKGYDNYVFCDNTYGDVVLEKSTITFNGSNSIIYLIGGNRKSLKIKATLNCDSAIYIGRNSSFHKTSTIHFVASECSSIIMGQDCLCSKDIWIRTGDAHPVYSTKTHERLNCSKSIIIGDHVWIGQEVMILKGTRIGSGAIIGAKSLCSGKAFFSNTSYGGCPARRISAEGEVFFDKPDLNAASSEELKKHLVYKGDEYIFHADKNKNIMQSIQSFFSAHKNVTERIEFFKTLSAEKNRFALSSDILED